MSDADDEDTLTVTVVGLPSGLSYNATTSQMFGTVSQTATVQDYTATITANDGTNAAVTETFTVSVATPNLLSTSGPGGEAAEASNATFMVTLSKSVAASVSVAWSATPGTAKAADSALGATSTFSVSTTQDNIDESNEDFTVSLSGPAGGGGPAPRLGTSKSVTTTITDDDGAPSSITLSVAPASISEDDGQTSVTVTATIDGSSTLSTSTVVTIGSLGGTATTSDYAVNTALASITIPAGQPSATGTLVLTPTDDAKVEGDETIIVGGSFGDLDIGSAVITVIDDDSPYLSITGPSAAVVEGAAATFTVTLSKDRDRRCHGGMDRDGRDGYDHRLQCDDWDGDVRCELGSRGHLNRHHSCHPRQPARGRRDL